VSANKKKPLAGLLDGNSRAEGLGGEHPVHPTNPYRCAKFLDIFARRLRAAFSFGDTCVDTWIECAWFKCRTRFEPNRRNNQYVEVASNFLSHASGIGNLGMVAYNANDLTVTHTVSQVAAR
jgi:hypothetical protein